MKFHAWHCASCQKRQETLTQTWDAYFKPEPEIMSSVVKVFSRLQQDETLILKGWKFDYPTLVQKKVPLPWLKIAGGFITFAFLILSWFSVDPPTPPPVPTPPQRAQIRFEDAAQHRVQIHYVEPRAIQSIEFETSKSGANR